MELDQRKQVLLHAVVDLYVRRAEPVGSEWLAEHQNLGVRSATIRNELAAMTEMGYLRQPHTSAGRIPSDHGYRYYVDRLMTWAKLSPGDASALRGIGRLTDVDLDELLRQTCRALTSLTRLTSIAVPPVEEAPRVRQIHLAQMAATQLLVVVVMESGRILHRMVDTPQPLKPADVGRLARALEESFRAPRQDAALPATEAPAELQPINASYRVLATAIGRALGSGEDELFLEGASHFLDQPEFRLVDKVEPIIRLLEQRVTLYEAVRDLLAGERLTVVIGAENPCTAMHECSLIAARYGVGSRLSGWIGVLGPTRMRYERALPTVSLAADALSRALTRLSGD
jgi:heat-inducible transcriptional repressor